ncbi:ExeM/NucH family extracellular endonuclease [Colwellia demingiae]|uniref:ExeM/NucH family extracellular endonuclease n=1 Tax=Colwellia demingiae TaxID=89401 RepID=A0A5C6Q8E5_9GAMM|nr:ExeM/NucH family extracellular endonuclease [Colwellia demingiae]TWX65294.1 ExeM/NucH family extracellular endonuclease [Colwellia demingiae]
MKTRKVVPSLFFGKNKLKLNSIALCVATSFVSYSALSVDTLWSEDFSNPALNNKGAIFETINMDGVTRWSIDVTNAQLTANSDWFKVTNNKIEARDVDGQVDWLSEIIDIQGKNNLNMSVLAEESGTLESADYFDLSYSIDGAPFVKVENWEGKGSSSHTLIDDFTSAAITQSIAEGSTLQIKASMANNSGSEYIRLDNVLVTSGIEDGGGDSGQGPIIDACFNCPDLSPIENAEEFDDTNYYAAVFNAIDSVQSTEVIRTNINEVISANHKQLTYSEAWTALTVTDEDPLNPDNVILFYRGISKAKNSNGSGSQSSNPDNWNREHVWAKSHGFPSSSAMAYSDIHHLRPTDISVNSSRGNLDFDNSDAPLPESPENRVDGNSFEPRDAVKGDVARIVLYMDTRYAGLDSVTPDLQVVDSLTSGGEAKLGKLCTLLTWSEDDPVDDFEVNRNNKIYEFQGNRNPFIDHPEWIATLYSASCSDVDPVDPVDPTDPPAPGADLFFSEYVEGSSFNKAIEIYNPTDSAISLENYQFKLYSNGSLTATGTYTLTGEILANDVVVLGSSQIADDSLLVPFIDHFVSAVNFNGDDYVELVHGDKIIDNIGTYGVRENWGKDTSLVRLSSITSGDIDRTDEFIKVDQWQSNPKDTFENLGSHLVDTSPTDPGTGEDPVIGMCSDEADKINFIQGSNNDSTVIGEVKVIEGSVTSAVPSLKGYFVQEEADDTDADLMTSEAIFVYFNNIANFPSVGNKVRILGTIKESYGRTQLTATTDFIDCGVGEPIEPTMVSLPVSSIDYWETIEGMSVSFNESLKVSDTYNLARYGQLTLSNGRLILPTNIYNAGSQQAVDLEDKNSRNRITLDDINNTQNPDNVPFPAPGLSHDNTLRLGDSVTGLYGVIDYSFNAYRVLPTTTPQFTATNARTSHPDINESGSLKVASFNVLNYFNGDGAGQGFPTARGADTLEEFTRQSSKIVSALKEINADIVGLMELENDGFDSNSAIADLVAQLNSQVGEGTYNFVSLDQAGVGGDAIAVGIIYKPATVAIVGNAVTTNQSPFDFGNRQPLVQTFKEIATNEELTIAVNHFKSKGSCGSASGNNLDQGDGQGCWNELRTQAASALTTWLSTNPTGSSDDDFLIIGDLNAYGKEDPINAITHNDYHNLVAKFMGSAGYSYSFGGEIGYLDHALASDNLASQVVDATVWHINADEPRIFDYNTEYKTSEQLLSYFAEDAYRASDHDPIIISLNLQSEVELIGDFDGDADIDRNDVTQFSMMVRRGETGDIRHDFNSDSVVNSLDVRALMSLCTRSRCATE